MNSIEDVLISSYQLIYRSIPCNKTKVCCDSDFIINLRSILNVIEIEKGIYFQIDKFDTFYMLCYFSNGLRKKVCLIENDTSIEDIKNKIYQKLS